MPKLCLLPNLFKKLPISIEIHVVKPNLPNLLYYYLKPQPSYYKWKIFSTAVLTLNFDLDLWKVNSAIWRRYWSPVANFMKTWRLVFDKWLPPHRHVNELTYVITSTRRYCDQACLFVCWLFGSFVCSLLKTRKYKSDFHEIWHTSSIAKVRHCYFWELKVKVQGQNRRTENLHIAIARSYSLRYLYQIWFIGLQILYYRK